MGTYYAAVESSKSNTPGPGRSVGTGTAQARAAGRSIMGTAAALLRAARRLRGVFSGGDGGPPAVRALRLGRFPSPGGGVVEERAIADREPGVVRRSPGLGRPSAALGMRRMDQPRAGAAARAPRERVGLRKLRARLAGPLVRQPRSPARRARLGGTIFAGGARALRLRRAGRLATAVRGVRRLARRTGC